MQRGEVWWADLGEPRGSSPSGNRPVLVVQADAFNSSRVATVVVAVVTSNVDLARAPGNVLVRQVECGLPRDSVVNVSHLITLDKRALAELAGRISFSAQHQVDEGIRAVLAL